MEAFPSCGEQWLLLVAVCGLLATVVSLVVERGLQVHGLQQLQHMGSVVVTRRLSCPMAHGIFSDQGSNTCPLPWREIPIHCSIRKVQMLTLTKQIGGTRNQIEVNQEMSRNGGNGEDTLKNSSRSVVTGGRIGINFNSQ